MNTPIADFLDRYDASNTVRLHMPGHKGKYAHDITEIPGADVLYHAFGIIRESEENAGKLFRSGRTLYSCEGASLCLRAMLYLLSLYARETGKRKNLLAARNAHQSFVTAAALLDFEVDWFCSATNLSCPVTPIELDEALAKGAFAAVYLTSPDYLGQMQNLSALSAVCRKRGVLLIVDNAHGAYLPFTAPALHPLACGADLCCDSAHKTLPALTGGAYLHIAQNAPALFARDAERAMALFASTSPSYLILRSLDLLNERLASDLPQELRDCAAALDKLKHELTQHGFSLVGAEPLKLTVFAKPYGYTGYELADFLAQKKLIAEMADPDHTVMMFAPAGGIESINAVKDALLSLPRREALTDAPPAFSLPERVLSLHEALFTPSETLPLDACEGRVLAAPTVSCPPAVPIAVCGERLDRHTLALMRYYGQTTCQVVKEH